MIETGTVHDEHTGSRSDGVLEFDIFRINQDSRSRDGAGIAIQKEPLEVLIYIVTEAPRLVPRDELLQRLWSRSVSDEALHQHDSGPAVRYRGPAPLHGNPPGAGLPIHRQGGAPPFSPAARGIPERIGQPGNDRRCGNSIARADNLGS